MNAMQCDAKCSKPKPNPAKCHKQKNTFTSCLFTRQIRWVWVIVWCKKTDAHHSKRNQKDTVAKNKTSGLLHALLLLLTCCCWWWCCYGGCWWVFCCSKRNKLSHFRNGSMKKHFEMTMLSLANFIISRFMTLNLNNHALQTHRFTTLHNRTISSLVCIQNLYIYEVKLSL